MLLGPLIRKQGSLYDTMMGSASIGRTKRPTSCTGTRDRCQLVPPASAPLTAVAHLNPRLGGASDHAGSRASSIGECAAALHAKNAAAEHANGLGAASSA